MLHSELAQLCDGCVCLYVCKYVCMYVFVYVRRAWWCRESRCMRLFNRTFELTTSSSEAAAGSFLWYLDCVLNDLNVYSRRHVCLRAICCKVRTKNGGKWLAMVHEIYKSANRRSRLLIVLCKIYVVYLATCPCLFIMCSVVPFDVYCTHTVCVCVYAYNVIHDSETSASCAIWNSRSRTGSAFARKASSVLLYVSDVYARWISRNAPARWVEPQTVHTAESTPSSWPHLKNNIFVTRGGGLFCTLSDFLRASEKTEQWFSRGLQNWIEPLKSVGRAVFSSTSFFV